jgi:hypothetical protein
MNYEWQVCTIEQAKELNELGVMQHSYWVWQELNPNTGYVDKRLQEHFNCGHPISASIVKAEFSAYNVAELGLMLPLTYNSVNDRRHDELYFSGLIIEALNDYIEYIPNVCSRFEAECRAGIIIKLLKDVPLLIREVNARLEARQ